MNDKASHAEVIAVLKHREEITRQFWALVRRRPFLFFRYLRQRREIFGQIREDLFTGKYLDA